VPYCEGVAKLGWCNGHSQDHSYPTLSVGLTPSLTAVRGGVSVIAGTAVKEGSKLECPSKGWRVSEESNIDLPDNKIKIFKFSLFLYYVNFENKYKLFKTNLIVIL
jgi:hypothetical protein